MNLEVLGSVNVSQIKTNIIWLHLYVERKKYETKKQKWIRPIDTENRLIEAQGVGNWGLDAKGKGIKKYKC